MTARTRSSIFVNKKHKCLFILIFLGALLGIGLMVFSCYITGIIENVMQNKLKEQLPIRLGSETFKNWLNSSVTVYMKFNMMNITNIAEILEGGRPKIQELGPYSYIEKRKKAEFEFRDDGQNLKYKEQKIFILDENTTTGDPFVDMVTTINPLIATIFANIEHNPKIEMLLNILHIENIFMTRTVNETLWGYEDPLIYEICEGFGIMCDKTIMGFMYGNNATNSSEISINTGLLDLSKIGLVSSYNDQKSLTIWSSNTANAINGSDGTMFKPNLKTDENIYVFASDVCRSFKFEYKKTKSATNDARVQLYQFVGTKDQAKNASVNPDNLGFCPKIPIGPKCPPGGLMDLTPCRSKGELLVPLVASQPRFYLSEPWVSEPYDGIPVGSENDQTQLNIEPTLGLPLEAYKRLQMNFYLRPSTKLSSYYGKMADQDWYFPAFWIEEGATADADTLNKLYTKVLGVVAATRSMRWGILGMGIVVLILSGITLALVTRSIILNSKRMRNKKENEAGTQNSHEPLLGTGQNTEVAMQQTKKKTGSLEEDAVNINV